MISFKSSIQKTARNIWVKSVEIKESQKQARKLDVNFPSRISMPEIETMPIYSYTLKDITEGNTFLTPSVYVASLQNVIYYPERESVFTSNRELITDSVMGHFVPEKYSLRKLYFSKHEKLEGVYSVFRSIFAYRNYYHTLIDYLPRIYSLTHYWQENKKLGRIKLLVSGQLTKVEDFFLTRLLPQDIEILNVNSSKVYRVEHLILPSFLTSRNSGYLPRAYLNYFHEKVLPKHPRSKRNLVYISRRLTETAGNRCILNEAELLARLKPYGFVEYYLEDMSIEEQINLFYHASFVIAPHGAGLTNIIFSDSINVLELFPGACLLPHYYFLSKSLGHNYAYWCAKSKQERDANFLVNIDEIMDLVRGFL